MNSGFVGAATPLVGLEADLRVLPPWAATMGCHEYHARPVPALLAARGPRITQTTWAELGVAQRARRGLSRRTRPLPR